MKKALKGLAPERYVLEDERGEDVDKPTFFQIRPLDGPEKALVWDRLWKNENGKRVYSTLGLVEAFNIGTTGWGNIEDPETGEELKFSRRNFRFIEPGWMYEVGQRILEISELSEDDRKN